MNKQSCELIVLFAKTHQAPGHKSGSEKATSDSGGASSGSKKSWKGVAGPAWDTVCLPEGSCIKISPDGTKFSMHCRKLKCGHKFCRMNRAMNKTPLATMLCSDELAVDPAVDFKRHGELKTDSAVLHYSLRNAKRSWLHEQARSGHPGFQRLLSLEAKSVGQKLHSVKDSLFGVIVRVPDHIEQCFAQHAYHSLPQRYLNHRVLSIYSLCSECLLMC